MSGASSAVNYPHGEQIANLVADSIMKLFNESLSVRSRIDTDAILSTVTAAIAERLPVTCMAILMKGDPDTSRIVFADEVNPGMKEYLEGFISILLRPGEAPTTGMSRTVIETGGPLLIPKMTHEQLFGMVSEASRAYMAAHPIPIRFNEIAMLMVPMRSGPAIVGTLALCDWQSSQVFSEADIDWFQHTADRIGLTIESAQLRNKAVDRVDRITTLSDIALAITTSQDLRVTFKLILERVIATLGVDAADIILVDENETSLVIAASTGFRSSSVADLRGQMPSDVAKQWVIEHNIGSPAAMEWIGQSRRWMIAREGFRSYTAAPLLVREKFVGALEVFSRGVLEADPEWLAFLDAMATHAAIAFDNATMYEVLRQAGRPHPARKSPAPSLTERERQILPLLVNGASNRDVAEKLHLSQNTIKFHVRQLLEKCGVANRTELATKAVHEGWA
jgi:GAF domain-containing protein/DNA-binding CsgD family transcriptional regulator